MLEYQHTTADTANVGPQLKALLGEGVISVVLFTSDGFPLASADSLGREATERTCAAFSGMHSLHKGLAEFCHTAPGALRARSQMIDFGTHTVLLVAAGQNSGLALAVEGGMNDSNVPLALGKALKLTKALEWFLAAGDRQLQPG
ncbi:roadblock/LC7 domain-containing protein (plasmid) [Streptomyces sp. NBC_00445]|uniref:roadblock/LC7 domain-containing protein n=1 Tax=Streptomyces sp. NBC_00445 TaxID=2975745 RepID=UPI002E207CB0